MIEDDVMWYTVEIMQLLRGAKGGVVPDGVRMVECFCLAQQLREKAYESKKAKEAAIEAST